MVTREVEREFVLVGDELGIRISVKNLGGEIDVLRIKDELPINAKLVRGSNEFVTRLLPREEKSFVYAISPAIPGRYTFSNVNVFAMDSMQFFSTHSSYPLSSSVTVYPYLEVDGKPKNLQLALLRMWPGEVVSRRQGIGDEFYSVREYIEGDKLKRVNWKASARKEEIYTNQFKAELSGEIMIVLDARFKLLPEGRDDESFNHCTGAAATLSYHLLEARNRVGLMIMGDLLDKVYPSSGKRQIHRILAKLSDVQQGRRWQISKLSSYMSLLFPGLRDVIIISPVVDEEVERAVQSMVYEGFNLTLISPDLFSRTDKLNYERLAAERLFQIERKVALTRIRRFALVIDWDVRYPLSYSLGKGMRFER